MFLWRSLKTYSDVQYLTHDHESFTRRFLNTPLIIANNPSPSPSMCFSMQCFLHYITPFIWRHSVVTILPHKLLELLDAPVTTMIGLPSAFREEKEFSRVREQAHTHMSSKLYILSSVHFELKIAILYI